MPETEIMNLIYRCAADFDRGDLVAAASQFRDARLKLDDKDECSSTHEDLLVKWENTIILYADGTPKTRHSISNSIIQIDSTKGTAACWSCFTVTQATESLPLQIIATGRYYDEFSFVDGRWRFLFRDFSLIDAIGDLSHHIRDYTPSPGNTRGSQNKRIQNSPARARILAAAQQAFSTVGYSEASMRKIAEMVGVAPMILFRNFSNKATLFEEALIDAIKDPKLPTMDRQNFGRDIAELLAKSDLHICPHSMTVLATGNEEARVITSRVLQEYALTPMAEWLGPPNAESRAREIFALLAGFALYFSRFRIGETAQRDPHMIAWLAKSVQAIIDQS